MTRALVFDYDGLMVDSERLAAEGVLAWLAGRGVERDMAAIAHLFGGTGETIDRLWHEFLADAVGRGGLDAAIAELDELFLTAGTGIPLLPGVGELITDARAHGWRVGLATGRRRDRLEPELARLGVSAHFDAVVTAEEVARGKPAPDVFLEVADRMGVTPGECVALEDSVHGAEAALAAGMRVVVCPSAATAGCGFPTGARRVESLVGLWAAGLG